MFLGMSGTALEVAEGRMGVLGGYVRSSVANTLASKHRE